MGIIDRSGSSGQYSDYSEYNRCYIERNIIKETARNLVQTIRDNGKVKKFVTKPWFPMLYAHEIRFDVTPIVKTRTMKAWDMAKFNPKKSWTAEADDVFVVLRFRSEDDKMLFRLAVL